MGLLLFAADLVSHMLQEHQADSCMSVCKCVYVVSLCYCDYI